MNEILSWLKRCWRRRWMRVGAVIGLAACVGIASPNRLGEPGQMPPNTVMLSEMMRELSAQPGFTEALIAQMQIQSKVGAAILTPELVHHLRELILGKDWAGLDRFPGWTMAEINPTVRVVGHVAGKSGEAGGLATGPGSVRGKSGKAASQEMSAFVDFGPYGLDAPHTEDLDRPSSRAGFSEKGLVNAVGDGVVRGDGADARLAPMHAESQRLAEVLNRLSLNGYEDSGHVTPGMTAVVGGRTVGTPQDLIAALLASGHTVEVADSRYFANFGHFHFKGQDVMMPFWVNSQIMVPGAKRPLLVPVSHAEIEWQIRGPRVNASLSHYFGIDGKAEFRVMDQLDQPWVMNRHAHVYRGAEAVEVTRLAGELVMAYAHQHRDRPKMPFGGYYGLGVCQDLVAAIELKMTGKATLFPLTSDGALFDDARDGEINGLMRALPKDRGGKAPGVERVFGSLPTEDLAGVTIPGFGADLVAVHQAWVDGTLERTHGLRHRVLVGLAWGVGALLVVGVVVRVGRRMQMR